MTKVGRTKIVHNSLDLHVRLKQAEMITSLGRDVTLKEVYQVIGKHCGVKGDTIAMIKSRNYNPSLYIALKLSEYFQVTVNELFHLKRGTKK